MQRTTMPPFRVTFPRLAPTLLAAILVVASCGGGSDNDSSALDDNKDGQGGNSIAASVDTSEPALDPTPINGALVSLLSPDLGLVAIERESGEFHQIVATTEGFAERETSPIVIGDTAYTLLHTNLPGQSFSHDVSLIAIDRITSELKVVAELGVDQETDDSSNRNTYQLLAVTSDAIWMRTIARITDESTGSVDQTDSIQKYDRTTGEALLEGIPTIREITNDAGTCTLTILDIAETADGTLYGISSDQPIQIDATTGEIATTNDPCGRDFNLEGFLDTTNINDFAVPESGELITPEQAELALGFFDVDIDRNDVIIAGGSAWWLFNELASVDGMSARIGGVVQMDPATGELTNLFPLGDLVATWLPEDDDFDVSPLQAELVWRNDALWILDIRDSGQLHRLNPADGTLDSFTIDTKGADYTTAELVTSDPEGIWLDITRWVISPDDAANRSGDGYILEFDPATESFLVDVSKGELIGF